MIGKIVQKYRDKGIFYPFELVKERVYSKILFNSLGYRSDIIIGRDTNWLAGRGVTVGTGIRIGRRCRIETITRHNNVDFHPKLSIGNNVSINDDVHIACAYNLSIGNDVLMAGKIFISDHNHGIYYGETVDSPESPPSDRLLSGQDITIEDRVWLGEMVSVLPGVTIGEGSIIGANSVVSRDIPPYTIAVGAPAKPIKFYDLDERRWKSYKDLGV